MLCYVTLSQIKYWLSEKFNKEIGIEKASPVKNKNYPLLSTHAIGRCQNKQWNPVFIPCSIRLHRIVT